MGSEQQFHMRVYYDTYVINIRIQRNEYWGKYLFLFSYISLALHFTGELTHYKFFTARQLCLIISGNLYGSAIGK